MSDIKVTDPNAVITSANPVFRLESGKTAVLKAYHVITQADLDAGRVINVASAVGKDVLDFVDRATSNEVTVFADMSPALSLSKTADEKSFSLVGDKIHYNNVVTNNGNVMITGITLTDPNTTALGSIRITALNPGESRTIRTVHTVTQTDLNTGSVEKTAIVTANDPNNQPMRFLSNNIVVVGAQNAALVATISSAEQTYRVMGEAIHYSVEVRNTGNVTLTDIRLSDINAQINTSGTMSVLQPGAVWLVSADHIVTMADLTAGWITNFATVAAIDPKGLSVRKRTNELTIEANLEQGLAVTETVTESSFGRIGEVIHYTITVTNHGVLPVSGIAVSDNNARITGNPVIPELAPAASAVVMSEHVVTLNDLNDGIISNRASISGNYPDGKAFTQQSNPVAIYAMRAPQLDVSLAAAENDYDAVGDTIHYTIDVANKGNITLTDITLSESGNITIEGKPAAEILPGASFKMTATYIVGIADLDAGKVVRSLNASAKDPDMQIVSVTGNEVSVAGLRNPQLTTIATAAETSFSTVGEVIHYTIRVTNSGNVTIISTAVTDKNAVIVNARPITSMVPGDFAVVYATHLVTQADIDAGRVVSLSTAAGFDLRGNTIEKAAKEVTVLANQTHDLTIADKADRSSFRAVGETIGYNILLRNTGNVTLYDVSVNDPIVSLVSAEPIRVMLPGEAISVAATHVVTMADLDAGEVVSLAKATAFDVKGKRIVRFGESVKVKGIQQPELTVSTTPSVPNYRRVDDEITYTVVVRNTGNVTMTNIVVTDIKDLLDFSRRIVKLAPGETDSVTAVYRVTMPDLNAGKIVTAGEASGSTLSSKDYSYVSDEARVKLLIENYNLSNFPNPFAYETTIVFDLPEKGEVFMKIYDMTGREIGQIEPKVYDEGRNLVHWSTLNANKGMYVLKMFCNGNQAVRLITIIE
jgi:uncharacterized repeat protein (TIGR01451 family)